MSDKPATDADTDTDGCSPTFVNGGDAIGNNININTDVEENKRRIIIPTIVPGAPLDRSKLTPQECVALEVARIQALRDADFVADHGRLLRAPAHPVFDPFRRAVLVPPGPLESCLRVLLSLFLVPLRLFVAWNGCVSAYALVKIFGPRVTAKDISEYSTADLPGWRRQICVLATRIMARSLLFALGFWGVNNTSPNPAHVHVKGATVVSNHVGIGDPILLAYLYAPAFVAKMAVAKLPFIGRVGSAQHAMYIDRFNGGVRNTTDAIVARQRQAIIPVAEGGTNIPPVCIFPEGTTTNGKFLLRFRTGAFVAGTPIQPVLLKYHNKHFPLSFEAIKAHKYVLGLITQPFNQVYYHQLPVYYPTEAEKSNPKLFADNVRQYMHENSTALFGDTEALQLAESNYIDKREYMTVLRGDTLQAGLKLTLDSVTTTDEKES